jgi:PS-10 peptidase S37
MVKISAIIFFVLYTCALSAQDVFKILKAIPNLRVEETTTATDKEKALRRFIMHITQPVDHFDLAAGTFSQKLVLFHRNFSEPMILSTSGYNIRTESLTGMSIRFETNLLQVEHRFYAGSIPDTKDWSKLTIRQSAEDFHHIVETLKPLYKANWINTGGSKGGVTSIIHRRFYPNDLNGTIAYVAPFTTTLKDPRYKDFLQNVGGDEYAECRKSLKEFQRILLEKKEEIIPFITEGDFSAVGSKEIAYEQAVIELPLLFWQYTHPEDEELGCSHVPNRKSSLLEIRNFLSMTNSVESYSNAESAAFMPYVYQNATELGWGKDDVDHLIDLLKYPDVNQLSSLPPGIKHHYTELPMKDIEHWVRDEAQNLMFIYGEFDPWSAGALKDVNANGDNHVYYVPQGNHTSSTNDLPLELKNEAESVVSRWLNKAPVEVKLKN